jgi:hypothetical protein
MAEPLWSNARPSPNGYHHPFVGYKPDPQPAPEERIRLLSSYSDDTRELHPNSQDPILFPSPIRLPVLNLKDPPLEHYIVNISRRVHSELNIVYMIKHDPVHYERCYVIWLGIDLD